MCTDLGFMMMLNKLYGESRFRSAAWLAKEVRRKVHGREGGFGRGRKQPYNADQAS